MRVLLDALLPSLLPPGWNHHVIPHQGWSDLQKSVPRKLKAWRNPNARFIVMRDNDRGDCHQRKMPLLNCVPGTGHETQTKVRIVCEELEAWALGDLDALAAVFGTPSNTIRRAACNPDTITHPSRILENHYGSYSKVTTSAEIALHMSPSTNSSRSFQAFMDAVRILTS